MWGVPDFFITVAGLYMLEPPFLCIPAKTKISYVSSRQDRFLCCTRISSVAINPCSVKLL